MPLSPSLPISGTLLDSLARTEGMMEWRKESDAAGPSRSGICAVPRHLRKFHREPGTLLGTVPLDFRVRCSLPAILLPRSTWWLPGYSFGCTASSQNVLHFLWSAWLQQRFRMPWANSCNATDPYDNLDWRPTFSEFQGLSPIETVEPTVCTIPFNSVQSFSSAPHFRTATTFFWTPPRPLRMLAAAQPPAARPFAIERFADSLPYLPVLLLDAGHCT